MTLESLLGFFPLLFIIGSQREAPALEPVNEEERRGYCNRAAALSQ